MLIIWGFRNKVRDDGPAIAATCPRCHNSVVLNRVHVRRWFTIFFIPLLPLGKGRSILMCPICRWGRDVNKESEALTAEMADITKQWQQGNLDDSSYGQRVEAYWSFAAPAGLPSAGSDTPIE